MANLYFHVGIGIHQKQQKLISKQDVSAQFNVKRNSLNK